MGRNPTPQAILDARGSFIHNPHLKKDDGAGYTKPLGGPPKHFDELEAEMWKEIKRDLLPGVAKKSDRHSFETLCLLKVKERSGVILAADRGQMITLLSHFGLTPASRTKVSIPAAPKSSLADFIKKSKPSTVPAQPAADAKQMSMDPLSVN